MRKIEEKKFGNRNFRFQVPDWGALVLLLVFVAHSSVK